MHFASWQRLKTRLWLVSSVVVAALAAPMALANTQAAAQPSAETATQTVAKPALNLSPFFIQLSDIMGFVKANDADKAASDLKELAQRFNALEQASSPKGQLASQALVAAQKDLSLDTLTAVSKALIAFDDEQHPVDVEAQKKAFDRKVWPAYLNFEKVINQTAQHPEADSQERLRGQYRLYNAIWARNEILVRSVSIKLYGQIETAMALVRVAIETSPLDAQKVATQNQALKALLEHFRHDDLSQDQLPANDGSHTLSEGIDLLKAGLADFKAGKLADGQAKLNDFITLWPVIEGDVSTRNRSLYNQVERDVPVIMAKGDKADSQQELQGIIDQLSAINPNAAYTALDAMFILLREGLEALFIVMALISALHAAKRPQGYKYVWAGVGTGVVASLAAAFALQAFFPAVTSGASREAIEGFVGIVAVVMILGVGLWLHSKSSMQAWKAYIQTHMTAALTTGSFLSLFGLSFLSVFREGAETILFYVGILPNIELSNFVLGVALALVLLVIFAVVMLKSTYKLPVPTLFKILTWALYILGFKILGVSVHALQLTGYLPLHNVDMVPNWDWIGLFSSVETLAAQAIYILAILILGRLMHHHDAHHAH